MEERVNFYVRSFDDLSPPLSESEEQLEIPRKRKYNGKSNFNKA
jgi:hypothetical protein